MLKIKSNTVTIFMSVAASLVGAMGFSGAAQAVLINLEANVIGSSTGSTGMLATYTQLNDSGSVLYKLGIIGGGTLIGNGLTPAFVVPNLEVDRSGHAIRQYKLNNDNTITASESIRVFDPIEGFSRNDGLYRYDNGVGSRIQDENAGSGLIEGRAHDLNDRGQTAYIALLDGGLGESRLYRAAGAGPAEFILKIADHDLDARGGQVRLDFAGNIYFDARELTGPDIFSRALFRVDTNNVLTRLLGFSEIVATAGGNSVNQGEFNLFEKWDVSNNGNIALSYLSGGVPDLSVRFMTYNDAAGLVETGLSTPAVFGSNNGTQLETNDKGDIAFFMRDPDDSTNLEVWASFGGGAPQRVAKAGDAIEGGGTISLIFDGAFDLNESGQISLGVSTLGIAGGTNADKTILRFDPEGTSPLNPILPDDICDRGFCFTRNDVFLATRGPTWYDPVVAIGYDYEVDAGAAPFTSVTIPFEYGDGLFDLFLFDDVLGIFTDSGRDLTTGTTFDFLAELNLLEGLMRFGIRGIEISAEVDPTDPEGFVTGLTFGGNGSGPIQVGFSMIPLTFDTDGGGSTQVPEPGTIALFGIGLLGLGFMRRRRRRA